MKNIERRPGRRPICFYLLVLPLLFCLAGASQGNATLPELQKQTAGSAPSANVGAADGTRETLTGFFAIGVIVDVLLVAAFLVWAVGQWRKKK